MLLDLLALLVLLEQLGRLAPLVRLVLLVPRVIQVLLDPQDRMEILPTKSLLRMVLSEPNPPGLPRWLEPLVQPELPEHKDLRETQEPLVQPEPQDLQEQPEPQDLQEQRARPVQTEILHTTLL